MNTHSNTLDLKGNNEALQNKASISELRPVGWEGCTDLYHFSGFWDKYLRQTASNWVMELATNTQMSVIKPVDFYEFSGSKILIQGL